MELIWKIICEKYLLNMEEKSFFLKKKTEKRQKKAKESKRTIKDTFLRMKIRLH